MLKSGILPLANIGNHYIEMCDLNGVESEFHIRLHCTAQDYLRECMFTDYYTTQVLWAL